MHFRTARLVARDLTREDFERFFEMQGNANVMRYATGQAQSEQEARADLDRVIHGYAQPENDLLVWAIERIADGAFIGTCAIAGPEHEIGFRLLERYWGHGYGQEIANGLIRFALGQLGVDRLIAYVYTDNVGSVKILERSPMRFVKEFFNEEAGLLDRLYTIDK